MSARCGEKLGLPGGRGIAANDDDAPAFKIKEDRQYLERCDAVRRM